MTLIIGKSVANAKQMATYLLSVNNTPKFSREISAEEFCQLFLDVCSKENVRGDIAFAQCLKETGNLKYGGDVFYTQNNFCGLGATGGVPGCSFASIEIGILAQAQHLKTYATKISLNETCVDPRRTNWFVNTKGGTAPNIEQLAGTWAVPGYDTKKYASLEDANKSKDSYGYQIVSILDKILKIKVSEPKYYRVQCGAYALQSNAIKLQNQLKQAGFETLIKKIGFLYKVQIGAFSKKENAKNMLKLVRDKGFNAFITYN